MAESYSDEELATNFVGLKEPAGLSMLVTAQRLLRERDEARRVAKILEKYIDGEIPCRDLACGNEACAAARAAYAYPETEP